MVSPFQKKPSVSHKVSETSKEEKKDVSAYQGKPHIGRGGVREWLRRPEIYKIIPRSTKGRAKLEKELFGPESGKYGPLIQKTKREAERLLKEINRGEAKLPPDVTKDQAKRLLKKFLGK